MLDADWLIAMAQAMGWTVPALMDTSFRNFTVALAAHLAATIPEQRDMSPDAITKAFEQALPGSVMIVKPKDTTNA